MTDILTRAQLEAQLERRQKFLAELEGCCADEKLIADVRKSIRLTQRRLERMQNADYEESIESITEIGSEC